RPPTAPKDAWCWRNNPNRVVLSWSPPEYTGGRNDTRYVVECVDCGGARLVYEPASSLTDRQVTVRGLQPETAYTFSNICSERRLLRLLWRLSWLGSRSACELGRLQHQFESAGRAVTRWGGGGATEYELKFGEQLDAYKEHLDRANSGDAVNNTITLISAFET
uniref:Fibronectin type-III domain-containing protein n=1 Tax=Macrostomum lignano TaxID=282301 RepID=A0A1I8FBE3_9PLAT